MGLHNCFLNLVNALSQNQFNLKALSHAQVLSGGLVNLSLLKPRRAGHQADALNVEELATQCPQKHALYDTLIYSTE